MFDEFFKDDSKEDNTKSALEKGFDDFLENNPFTKGVKDLIQQAADSITDEMEIELNGKTTDRTERKPILDHFDEQSKQWDSMFHQIVDKHLNQYKICPKCGQYSPSDAITCMNCGTPLPEHTAAYITCPYCSAQNKVLDTYCRNCGKKIEFISKPEE